MVIWPSKISRDDHDWTRVCALLLVLSLDPRCHKSKALNKPFYECADDYLVRPMIYVDRRHVPAPYYTFSVYFSVSASFHGRIALDDEVALAEFRKVMNGAINGPLTVAERKHWIADRDWRRCIRANDPMAEVYSKLQQDESDTAMRWYHDVRQAIEAPRQNDGVKRGSLSTHEEILHRLLELGGTMREMNATAAS